MLHPVEFWFAFFLMLPVSVAIAFVAFAIGRRRFSLIMLFVLITCECIAIWLASWVPVYILKSNGA
ncbi:MAG: hypothetical protein ACR2FY_06615 [Pirellulaceae bacterium]